MRAVILVAACVLGACGPLMSPTQAYLLEIDQCKAPDAEATRKCEAMVDKKYANYLNSGQYPPLNE